MRSIAPMYVGKYIQKYMHYNVYIETREALVMGDKAHLTSYHKVRNTSGRCSFISTAPRSWMWRCGIISMYSAYVWGRIG